MSLLPPPPTIARTLAGPIGDFVRRYRSIRPPAAFGLTSWWRSIAHNLDVGGNPRSQHLLGLALDTTPVRGADRAAMRAAFVRAGLYPIDEGDHIHLQAYPGGSIPAAVFRLAI